MRIRTLAAASILLSVSAANACINDSKTESTENEFRSAYQKLVEPMVPSPIRSEFPWGVVALSAGIGLIIGGSFAVIHLSRK